MGIRLFKRVDIFSLAGCSKTISSELNILFKALSIKSRFSISTLDCDSLKSDSISWAMILNIFCVVSELTELRLIIFWTE